MQDEGTGEAIPDATIRLDLPKQDGRVLRTDDRGRAVAEALCEGEARVVVEKREHETTQIDVDIAGPKTQTALYIEALHAHHSHRVVVVHDEGAQSMATSESLAGADLAKTRGMGLADAVSGIAGVTTLRGSAGGMAKPVIRGQIGRRNLIIFDGVRHEGQKWGLDHAPEIDPYAAGRITVVKGAATTRFGPDAIGGAVLVDPRPMMRAPGVSAQVSTVGTSNALGGGGAIRLDHAPRWGRGFAWRVEGNIARHRAAIAPDYPLDNTGAMNWNAGARLGFLNEAFDVVGSYRILRSTAGICSCLRVSSADEFEKAISDGRPIGLDSYSPEFAIERPRQEVWHHMAMARSRVDLGKAGELHASYAYQYNDRSEFDVVRQSVTGPQLAFQLGTHTGDVRYEVATVELARRWALVGTVGGRVSQQANDFDSAATLIPDYEQWSGGVFAVERLVHPRLEVEVGARYEGLGRSAALEDRDYLALEAGGRLDEDGCERTDFGGRCELDFHAPSATVGVLARPFERMEALRGLSARVQLDSSGRIPAIDEQFMNGAAPSFPILGAGDSRLGVERTWGGTATLRYELPWLLAEVAGYGNYVDDYIYFAPEPQEGQCAPLTCTIRGPFPLYAFRPVDAAFGGAELRLDLQTPRLPFEVSGNAAWVRGFNLDDGGNLALVPADRYQLTGRYLWPDTGVSSRGYFEVTGTVVDKQRRLDEVSDFAPAPDAYVLLGAGVGVEFPAERRVVRMSLTGQNLLNARYREYTSLLRYFADEPGWSLTLRLSVEWAVFAPTGEE